PAPTVRPGSRATPLAEPQGVRPSSLGPPTRLSAPHRNGAESDPIARLAVHFPVDPATRSSSPPRQELPRDRAPKLPPDPPTDRGRSARSPAHHVDRSAPT